MKDLILALLGPKHCDWCRSRTDPFRLTWFERKLDMKNTGYNQGNLLQRIYIRWVTFNTDVLKIWRLGQIWHRRHVRQDPE